VGVGVGEFVGDGGFVGLGLDVDGLGDAVALGHTVSEEDDVAETTSPHGPIVGDGGGM
jgi:hypothetical protein